MPGQNGFQLTRAITRDPRFSDVPVIMCTSKNQETDKVWGMRQGARDYIVKPVDADELVGKITRLRLTAPDRTRHGQQAKHCANSRAGWPSACRRRAPSRAAVLAGGRVRRRAASCSRCARPARSSPSAPLLPVPHTPAAGSSAWPTCAATCTASSTWRGFLGAAASRRRREAARDRRGWSASTRRSDVNCALLVDRLAGLRSADQLTRRAGRRRHGRRPAFAGARWRDADGRVWQELNLVGAGRRRAVPGDRRAEPAGAPAHDDQPKRVDMSFLDKIKSWRRAMRAPTRAAYDSQFDDVVDRVPRGAGSRCRSRRAPSQTRGAATTRPCSYEAARFVDHLRGGAVGDGRLQRDAPAGRRPAASRRAARPAADRPPAPAQQQQRILLGLVGARPARPDRWLTVLALSSAARSESAQVGATGQALMQSQRLAKSVSQALVGSPQAFPEVQGERRGADAATCAA